MRFIMCYNRCIRCKGNGQIQSLEVPWWNFWTQMKCPACGGTIQFEPQEYKDPEWTATLEKLESERQELFLFWLNDLDDDIKEKLKPLSLNDSPYVAEQMKMVIEIQKIRLARELIKLLPYKNHIRYIKAEDE